MDGSTFYSLRIGFIFLADRKTPNGKKITKSSWKSSNIESKSLKPFFFLLPPFNKVSTCVICEGVFGEFYGGQVGWPPTNNINKLWAGIFFSRLLLCSVVSKGKCVILFFIFRGISCLTLWLFFIIILGISDHLNSWPEWKFAWLLLFCRFLIEFKLLFLSVCV